jgi:aldose 1-epimerase
MTKHGYFNLGPEPTIHGHHLAVAADAVVPVDGDGIPTGPPVGVDGTAFDLRRRTRLGPLIDALDPGLDHCFVVRGDAGTVRPAAVLDDPISGRWMTVAADQPGLQVYTGNGLKPPFPRYGSVSLETQLLPDTPNRPEFGSAVLRPGEEYVNVTVLRFGAGAPPALDDLPALADDEGGGHG